jgi:protein-tyrosine phosphatase
VTDGILAGSKPTRDADFIFLKSQGVRFLLQPRFLPFLAGYERSKAKRYGMEYLSVPMNASPFAPSEKHVNAALRIMRTKADKPLYLHCVLGRDRTSLLVGLYMIYFEGASKEQAYAEMKAEGFRTVFFVHGLKAYFDKHTKLPPELADLAVSEAPHSN